MLTPIYFNHVSHDSVSYVVKASLINVNDIHYLMEWKNQYSSSFFDTRQLTASMQRKWYVAYSQRQNDYMFILSLAETPFGCIGCRIVKDQEWNLYNVINALPSTRGKGIMSSSLDVVVQFCRDLRNLPITLVVLNDNPALQWYFSNNFSVVDSNEFSTKLILDF